MSVDEREVALLGISLIKAQKVEFALYGLAAHASHMPVAQSDKRFRELTPEAFLRGDLSALKATLGQLLATFGEVFMIETEKLLSFRDDRNLIVHDYWRIFHTTIAGVEQRSDGVEFLQDFIGQANHWQKVLDGLMKSMMVAAAGRDGEARDFTPSPQDAEHIEAFYAIVEEFRAARTRRQQAEDLR